MSAPTRLLSPADLPLAVPSVPQRHTDASGSAALAITLALRPDLWRPLVDYREETRWTRLLEPAALAHAVDPGLHPELDRAEIWLLSWLPGQGTALHDHGPSSGAFAVADGTVFERVVTANRRGRRARELGADLVTGRVRMFGPHYVHQVRNIGAAPAVSVHVYAPRLTVMNTYRSEDARLTRIGTERAGVDW
jgi:Cysteine dioxygenase type I